MLTDTSSTAFPVLQHAQKRRRRASLYFSSSKALKRSRMTKGRKAVSKTNDTSDYLRRTLRFRAEGGEAEDVYAQNFDSLDAIPEDITGQQIQECAHRGPNVRFF